MKLGEEAGDEDVKKGEEKEGELLADSFDLRDLINICLAFCQPGGSHRVVKCQTSILEKVFFTVSM